MLLTICPADLQSTERQRFFSTKIMRQVETLIFLQLKKI